MRACTRALIILWLVTGFLLSASAAVSNPWVTTDRTIDCSSYETILKGVLTSGMTDEQKSIALFTFFRQRVYHYMPITESRDPLVCVNVIGNTLCGSQGTCMKGLLAAAGIKAHVVSGPGHTFYEAFYDGRWHGYDTFCNFYIMTRGDKPYVASFEELEKDPSLIADASKESRCPAGMCPCGDDPMFFSKHVKVTEYEPLKVDWSVKQMSLRKGETMIRSWWPAGKPLPGSWSPKNGPGPLHTCGTKDRHDNPELFKFWEPYGIPHLGPSTTVSYRHYFNGLINYSPDLTTDAFRDGIVSVTGVNPGPNGLTGGGTLIVPQACPFYISSAQCLFSATCPGSDDSVSLFVSQNGQQWVDVAVANEKGIKTYTGNLDKVVVSAGKGYHDYQIKFVLKGQAVLNHYLLQTWFTHNAMAAPHLMPGANQVTVAVSNPDSLAASDLRLTYRYREAPAWTGDIKSIEQKITKSPFTYTVTMPATEKLPQMVDLALSNGQPVWMPENAWHPPAPVDPFVAAKKPEPAAPTKE